MTLDASRAVYTGLFGGYEQLNEQPMARSSSVPFICFTDDRELTSDTWQVRLIEPAFPRDVHRSARRVKILVHEYLPEHSETLWIDNTVILTAPPEGLIDEWLREVDFALARHSYRDTVLDEFNVVVSDGLDDPSRVFEQLLHYSDITPAILSERPFWAGMLARRSTPAVRSLMTEWFEHVLRYSRRDQLSLNLAISRSVAQVRGLDIDNFESAWHRWPTVSARSGRMRSDGFKTFLQPAWARVRELELQVDDLQRSLREDQNELDATIQGLRAERDTARREGEAYRMSHSWRVTAPARRAGAIIRAALRPR